MPDVEQILGKVSLTPRGAYSPTETYERLDAVQHEGSGYVALRSGLTGVTPADGEDWMLLASRGETGKRGPRGQQGPQGEQGTGFRVLGYYESEEVLRGAVTAPEAGDAYGVGTEEPYDFYIYGETENGPDWKNYGPLQGPAGKDGVNGKDGQDGQSGDTWVPSVDPDSGDMTWAKNSGDPPPTVNIKGPKGDPGADGDATAATEAAEAASAAAGEAEKIAEDIRQRISNSNLLENWDFACPINQRGESVYNVKGYTIDRWILGWNDTQTPDGSTITLSKGYITWSGSGSWLIHRFPNTDLTGRMLTFSVLLAGGTLLSGSNIYEYGAGSTTYFDSTNLTAMAQSDETVGQWRVAMFNKSSSPLNIVAAKLELGSVQTLAHKEGNEWVLNDPPPNYALELAKCQRYYEISESANTIPDSLPMMVYFQQEKRIAPTITIIPSASFKGRFLTSYVGKKSFRIYADQDQSDWNDFNWIANAEL